MEKERLIYSGVDGMATEMMENEISTIKKNA